LTIGILLWFVAVPGTATSGDDFLIPGADFSQLVFKEGAWCRYLVLDQALGQTDSTEVYVGVPASEMTPRGRAFWVELASKPIGTGNEGGEVLKLLVLESIRDFSEGDSVGKLVLRLYIKKGARPAEEEDPEQYEDFALIVPSAESSWESSPDVLVKTAAGEFRCTKKSRSVRDKQEIPTGKVKIIKKSRDDYTVWFCDEIPVFRMAKCVIERSRETDMVPRIAGIPVSGRKHSATAAELTGLGFDAKPILSHGSAGR
jgi:hypothetical protein